ncbi:MAG TPA: hypothetical protein VNO50_14110, partial [Pyrinomonadaceae bacterium]|nr:hypothetical protein [Pyrinomonadaceae bacterium]
RPPARHNDLRSISLRVDEFPFPMRIPGKSPPTVKQTGTHSGANRQAGKSERSDAGNLFIA